MNEEKLEIIDENENVIGTDNRANIHEKGLLHREINVWFVTPNKKMIFQVRSRRGIHDATVGGHVEIGEDFIDAAIRETKEETFLVLSKDELKLVLKEQSRHYFREGNDNNRLKATFIYRFNGDVNDLRAEERNVLEFKALPIEEVLTLDEKNETDFIPSIFKKKFKDMLKKL